MKIPKAHLKKTSGAWHAKAGEWNAIGDTPKKALERLNHLIIKNT